MDLTFSAFERFVSENCHAKFGGNWTTNQGETRGGGGGHNSGHTSTYPLQLIQLCWLLYFVCTEMQAASHAMKQGKDMT